MGYKALVIGVNEYIDDKYNLKNAYNDAESTHSTSAKGLKNV